MKQRRYFIVFYTWYNEGKGIFCPASYPIETRAEEGSSRAPYVSRMKFLKFMGDLRKSEWHTVSITSITELDFEDFQDWKRE